MENLRSDRFQSLRLDRFLSAFRSGEEWDIKHDYPYLAYDPEAGVGFERDIWENIHYGYLMREKSVPDLISLGGAEVYSCVGAGVPEPDHDIAAIKIG